MLKFDSKSNVNPKLSELRSSKKNPLKGWCDGRHACCNDRHHLLEAIGEICCNTQNCPQLHRSRPFNFHGILTFGPQFGASKGRRHMAGTGLRPWTAKYEGTEGIWRLCRLCVPSESQDTNSRRHSQTKPGGLSTPHGAQGNFLSLSSCEPLWLS